MLCLGKSGRRVDGFQEPHDRSYNLELNKSLLRHIISNDRDMIKECLKGGADINYQDHPEDMTALHHAVNIENLPLVQEFLGKGSSRDSLAKCPDSTFAGFMTPLMLAIDKNNEAIVEILVKYGASITLSVDDCKSALHFTMMRNNPSCLQAILNNSKKCGKIAQDVFDLYCGCNINQEAAWRAEALLLLAMSGVSLRPSVICWLFQYALNQNISDDLILKFCKHFSQQTQHKPTIDCLVGVQMPWLHYAALKDKDRCIDILIEQGTPINGTDNYKRTPLHVAAENNCLKAIKTLLVYGPDSCLRNNAGDTPLQCAISKGHAQVVWLLAQREVFMDPPDSHGLTGFCRACSYGNKEIMQILLGEGANPNHVCQNDTHAFPLQVLVESLDATEEAVQLLISSGADVFKKDFRGSSLLHLAMKTCKQSIIDILLDAGLSSNALNDNGDTPLHTLIRNKSFHEENRVDLIARQWIVRKLVGAELNILILNEEGDSALSLAIETCDIELAKYLLQITPPNSTITSNGYSCIHLLAEIGNAVLLSELYESGYFQTLDNKEPNGATALMIAAAKGNSQVTEYLLEKNANFLIKWSSGTILHCLVHSNMTKVLQSLLVKGGIENILEECNEEGITAAGYAFYLGHAECFKWLLARGAAIPYEVTQASMCMKLRDGHISQTQCMVAVGVMWDGPLYQNRYSTSPISEALRWTEDPEGVANLIEDLLAAGFSADVIFNEDQNVPLPTTVPVLIQAAKVQNARVVKALLKSGTDVSKTDEDGNTILHLMVRGLPELTEHMEEIIQIGASAVINTRNTSGLTPLFLACMLPSSPKIVAILLQNGANPDMASGESANCTPIEQCLVIKQHKIVTMLLLAHCKLYCCNYSPNTKGCNRKLVEIQNAFRRNSLMRASSSYRLMDFYALSEHPLVKEIFSMTTFCSLLAENNIS